MAERRASVSSLIRTQLNLLVSYFLHRSLTAVGTIVVAVADHTQCRETAELGTNLFECLFGFDEKPEEAGLRLGLQRMRAVCLHTASG